MLQEIIYVVLGLLVALSLVLAVRAWVAQPASWSSKRDGWILTFSVSPGTPPPSMDCHQIDEWQQAFYEPHFKWLEIVTQSMNGVSSEPFYSLKGWARIRGPLKLCESLRRKMTEAGLAEMHHHNQSPIDFC